MKKLTIFIGLLLLIGCAYEGERLSNYLDNPKSLIRDPHYADYVDQRDELESQYLRKDITYAEYLERKKRIDDNYTVEVNERTKIIDSTY